LTHRPASFPIVNTARAAEAGTPAAGVADILPEGARLVVQLGHGSAVTRISLSADQRLLASASLDRSVKLWDLPSGKLLQPTMQR
jgi:WD40 repeat protein